MVDTEDLRALAHPLRLRILSLLTPEAMSAAEAARELGASHATVSYHFRRLHGAGLIQLAEEVPIRGGVARRFRRPPGAGLRPGVGSAPLADALGRELRRRAACRDAGSPEIMTDAELWIDPDVWREVLHGLQGVIDRLHTAAQPARTPGTIPVSALLWWFPIRPGPAGG